MTMSRWLGYFTVGLGKWEAGSHLVVAWMQDPAV